MDRLLLKSAFERYVSAFDSQDERISGKITHTYRVAANCLEISGGLGLGGNDTDIAFALGMLHDIGRFRQAEKYKTFLDSVSDHAEEGADYLFSDGHIADFIPDLSAGDTRIIEKAIRLHNKHLLPSGLDERELMFCNIIRDADKIDIFRFMVQQSFAVSHEYPEDVVKASYFSDAVLGYFKRQETVLFSERETPADIYLSHVALCFGLVYPSSRRLLNSDGYIRQMMELRFDNPSVQKQYEELSGIVREFLNE